MSALAKTVFGLCCATSLGIIAYVHCKQDVDRENLHLGVLRDIERRQRRKTENLVLLQQQSDLTKALRREELKRSENESAQKMTE